MDVEGSYPAAYAEPVTQQKEENGSPYSAHDSGPLPAGSFRRFGCSPRCPPAQRAPMRFTGSLHRRHLPNGGPTQGRHKSLVIVVSEPL